MRVLAAARSERPAALDGSVRSAPPRRRPPRRGAGGVVLLPPWTRAPFLPFRQPAVILAVFGAAVILACASSSGLLFLSSAAAETLHRMLAAQCADAAFPTVRAKNVVADPARGVPATRLPVQPITVDDREVRTVMRGLGLAEPSRVLVSDETPQVAAGGPSTTGLLFYGDGATRQITPVGPRTPGAGIWLPEQIARSLGVRAGTTVSLSATGATGGSAPVRVVGVYRDLFAQPIGPYWCAYATLFLYASTGNDAFPPQPVIATDVATFERLREGYGGSSTDRWVSAVDLSGVTLSQGQSIAAKQHEAYRRLGLPEPEGLAERTTGTGQMPELARRAGLTRDGLRGPVLPIALGGSILALLLVGAAGSYWADRRSREVRLLSSRGVGPGALAVKAVFELALPAVVGTVAGWLLARWLVGLLGPSPRLDRAAPWQAGLTALIALAAGLGLLALVAGLRSRAATERPVGARRGWVAVVPWELLILAAAAGCWLRLRGSDAVTLDAGIAQINLLVVAFPLLFLAGAAVLIVRLLALLLPRLGRSAGRLPAAWYLAARRVTASRVISVILLAAASLPIAMLVYAATLTQTSQYTLDAKAGLINGSTTSVQSVDPVRRTTATDAVGTLVVRYLYGKVGNQPDDVTVLAIDPDTFTQTAFWDRRFASDSLDALMAKLRAPTAGGVVPAVAVVEDGPEFPPGAFELGLGTTRLRTEVVAHATHFSGRRVPGAMLIVDRSRLGTVDRYAGFLSEMWSRDTSPDRARDAVTAQHARIYLITSQDTVFDVANFLGVSWSFGYLSALAALVGLVAIGGLLLYLETRQRSRTASYALGKRMGLTRATHLRSLLAELGVLLGLAWVIGAALAWTAVLLVYHRLDIDPTRPPTPLLTIPVLAFAGSAIAVAVVVVLAALYAQRSADRADVSEVLRLGT